MHNLPSSLSGGGSNLVYASSTNSIYMMATNVSGNALWKYPIGDSNDWAAVATSSPYGSGNLTYSSYDNALYSFYSNNNSYLQRYDLATGNWTKPGEA